MLIARVATYCNECVAEVACNTAQRKAAISVWGTRCSLKIESSARRRSPPDSARLFPTKRRIASPCGSGTGIGWFTTEFKGRLPMKPNCIRHRTSAFAAGVLAAAVGVSASAAPPTISPLNRISLRGDAAQIEVFVQLDTPSVAELNISTMQATGALASSEIQRNQAAQVDAQQSVFRQSLASLGATELGALRVGANGLRLRINTDQLDTLKSLPGVRTVGRVQLQHLTNITSVPWIGAPAVWNSLHAKGEHIKIGIIDTGIDYTHANFGGSGNPADYTKINPDVVAAGTFPTAKVKGGIDFAGHTYDARDPASVPKP